MADQTVADNYVFDRSYIDNTRIWLSDLSHQVPPTAKLDGFDVSLVQAEPHAWLPSNMHLRQWDVMTDVPVDLFGQYDAVHVRLLVFVIKDDLMAILRKLISLLKPGGWLQWGEPDIETFKLIKTDPSNPTIALEKLTSLLSSAGPTTHSKWVKDLPSLFEKAGLEDSRTDVCARNERNEYLLHECNLLGYETMGFGTKGDQVISEAAKETKRGVMAVVDRMTVIGRKAGGDAV